MQCALGLTGCPAGVQNEQRILPADIITALRLGAGGTVEQGVEGVVAVRAVFQPVLYTGAGLLEVVERGLELPLGNQGTGFAIGDDIGDFGIRKAPVDGVGDQPGFAAGEKQCQKLDAVLGQDGHPVPLDQSE